MTAPGAILIANGIASFFDENDEQMTELQRQGWKGLHEFLETYPDGDVRVALGKNEGLKKLSESDVERLVDHIKKPEE
jgi:hypothetical protein